jgi:hypothetical protein
MSGTSVRVFRFAKEKFLELSAKAFLLSCSGAPVLFPFHIHCIQLRVLYKSSCMGGCSSRESFWVMMLMNLSSMMMAMCARCFLNKFVFVLVSFLTMLMLMRASMMLMGSRVDMGLRDKGFSSHG